VPERLPFSRSGSRISPTPNTALQLTASRTRSFVFWALWDFPWKTHVFCLVLAHQKAMHQKRLMADSAEKRGELVCAVLMQNNEFVNHGKS
jgi:hypothetical protein